MLNTKSLRHTSSNWTSRVFLPCDHKGADCCFLDVWPSLLHWSASYLNWLVFLALWHQTHPMFCFVFFLLTTCWFSQRVTALAAISLTHLPCDEKFVKEKKLCGEMSLLLPLPVLCACSRASVLGKNRYKSHNCMWWTKSKTIICCWPDTYIISKYDFHHSTVMLSTVLTYIYGAVSLTWVNSGTTAWHYGSIFIFIFNRWGLFNPPSDVWYDSFLFQKVINTYKYIYIKVNSHMRFTAFTVHISIIHDTQSWPLCTELSVLVLMCKNSSYDPRIKTQERMI